MSNGVGFGVDKLKSIGVSWDTGEFCIRLSVNKVLFF